MGHETSRSLVRKYRRPLVATVTVGTILLGAQGCTSEAEPKGQQPPTQVAPKDKCVNLEGLQRDIPVGLHHYAGNCLTAQEIRRQRDRERKYQEQQNELYAKLIASQDKRDQELKARINALPVAARAPAILGIVCTNPTVGGPLLGNDGTVQTYSDDLLENLYERYADNTFVDLPFSLYGSHEGGTGGAVGKLCPEIVGAG